MIILEKRVVRNKYAQLRKRIRNIQKNFEFDQSSSGPTLQQSDQIRGMIRLCHAEFEAYIEGLALLLLEDGFEKWSRTKKANYNISMLFLRSEKIYKKDSFITQAFQVKNAYTDLIRKNNGIKEENIVKIFDVIGYSINDFDTGFISDLNSFGHDRGAVAHTSATAKSISVLYDLPTEQQRIGRILDGIRDFQNVLLEKVN